MKKTNQIGFLALSMCFGLLGGFISVNIFNQPVNATKNTKVVYAEEFQLIDKNGTNRGGLKSLEDGSALIYLQNDSKDKNGIKIKVDKKGTSLNIYNKSGNLVTKLGFDGNSEKSSLAFFPATGFNLNSPVLPEILLSTSKETSGLSIFSENKPLVMLQATNNKSQSSLLLMNKDGKSTSLLPK